MFTRIARLTSIVVAVFVFQAIARADGPGVLTQVPDNSVAVLVISEVDALKIQIANYAKQMDVPLPADPLAVPLQSLGITGGFDATGSLAVVQMPVPQKGPASADPNIPFILLLPTTDAKLLMAGMSPGEAADNITPVTFANNTSGYAAVIGKYVAIGRNRAMLADFLAHKGRMEKPSPQFLKAIDEDNVAIWIDVSEEAKVVGPLWKPYAAMMRMMIGRGNPGAQGLQGPQAAINMVDALGDALSSDVQSALIGLKISEEGINLDVTGMVTPDSTLAKFAAAQKAVPVATLAGLPGGEYITAGAAEWDPAFATTAVDKLMDFGMAANPILQNNPDLAAKMKEIGAQAMALETGMRMSMDYSTDPKATGLKIIGVIDTKDPQKLLDLTVKNAMLMDGKGGDFHYDILVKPDALLVGGISFTQMNYKISPRDETPDNRIPEAVKQQIQAMQRFIPATGLVYDLGVVGNHLVMVMTPDAKDTKTIEETIAAVQADKNNFAGMQNAAVEKKLALPDATAVGYLRIDRAIAIFKAVAGMAEEAPAAGGEAPQPAVAPQPTAAEAPSLPLIWSFRADGQSATSRIALPKKTLIKLVEQARAASDAAQSP